MISFRISSNCPISSHASRFTKKPIVIVTLVLDFSSSRSLLSVSTIWKLFTTRPSCTALSTSKNFFFAMVIRPAFSWGFEPSHRIRWSLLWVSTGFPGTTLVLKRSSGQTDCITCSRALQSPLSAFCI
uniref:Uncharacterized protein n=1 Tax=Cacopsylla melanoneura TaxID=428564 RepID=A0A8D9AX58_9HEMI